MTVRGVFASAKELIELQPDDVVFSEGDEGEQMYGVVAGEIELRRGDDVVGRIGPDGTFGELAIIDRAPRSLSAVAIVPSTVTVIDRHTFLFLVHETPTFALDVMRSLASRIRQLDERRGAR